MDENMNVKISFHGAAKAVTGSQFLLQTQGKKILVECGLTQGKRKESYELNKHFRFPDGIKPQDLDAVVLTHAHIDHSGNLPTLVSQGFRGQIHATETTVQLCRHLLTDSAYLQNEDLRYANKIRQRQNKTLFTPLYTSEDVEKTMQLFVSHKYKEEIELFDGIKIKFRDAGHILGSAGVIFYLGTAKKPIRFGFSGDIGREDVPLMRNPDILRELDFLAIETTYGNRSHSREFELAKEQFSDAIVKAMEKKGTILIPAFSVGRMQLLIYILHKLRNAGILRDIPVYVDSPLGLKATKIFQDKLSHLDSEVKRYFREERINPDGSKEKVWLADPFDFSGLTYVKSAEESRALGGSKGKNKPQSTVLPRIIISSSGMMEGGRILHHLTNHIGDATATILFVGYAAQHTLARQISDGVKKVKIYGEPFEVKCNVVVLDSFSAHADLPELIDYVSHSPAKNLKKLFLVHGEEKAAENFLEVIKEKGYDCACVPNLDEEYSFYFKKINYFDTKAQEDVERYELIGSGQINSGNPEIKYGRRV